MNFDILENGFLPSKISTILPEEFDDIEESERAMLLYSYIGHAYIWGNLDTDKVIPKNISKTWFKVSQKL